MGLTDLRQHTVVEHVLLPEDVERMYYSNRGAIYGVVSNRLKNYSFKAPKQSKKYRNLFFVGAAVELARHVRRSLHAPLISKR